MRTHQEHTGPDSQSAVEEAERILRPDLPSAQSAPRRATGADRIFLLFSAIMALCLVVFAVWFSAIPALGASLAALVMMSAAALWFAYVRRMGGSHGQ